VFCFVSLGGRVKSPVGRIQRRRGGPATPGPPRGGAGSPPSPMSLTSPAWLEQWKPEVSDITSCSKSPIQMCLVGCKVGLKFR
jgi:hypothetical protein